MNYWNRQAQLIVKGLLARAGISHKVLAARLQKMGATESEAAIANKISRGAFTFAFVLRVAAAVGESRIDLRRTRIGGPVQRLGNLRSQLNLMAPADRQRTVERLVGEVLRMVRESG